MILIKGTTELCNLHVTPDLELDLKNQVTLLIIPIFRHIYMRKGNGLDVFCRTAEAAEKEADAPTAAALKVQFPNTLPVNLNPE